MRYDITYINITEEKRFHYVIVILNIATMYDLVAAHTTLSLKSREKFYLKLFQRCLKQDMCSA